MNSKLFAKLEDMISDWGKYNAEMPEYERPDVLWPEDLAENMARAAAAVFEANRSGQDFAAQQEKEE